MSSEDLAADGVPVKRLLALRRKNGKQEYLVEWEGFDLSYSEWIEPQDIASDVIDAFAENNRQLLRDLKRQDFSSLPERNDAIILDKDADPIMFCDCCPEFYYSDKKKLVCTSCKGKKPCVFCFKCALKDGYSKRTLKNIDKSTWECPTCKRCQKCRSADENDMMFCDRCDEGRHRYCDPMYKDRDLPGDDEEYVCPRCRRSEQTTEEPAAKRAKTEDDRKATMSGRTAREGLYRVVSIITPGHSLRERLKSSGDQVTVEEIETWATKVKALLDGHQQHRGSE